MKWQKIAGLALGYGFVAIISFMAGTKFQQSRTVLNKTLLPSRPATGLPNSPSGGQFSGRFGGRNRPTSGDITAMGGTNLTLKLQDGTTANVSLTAQPAVSDAAGSPLTVADLKVGDTVAVFGRPDSSGTIAAQRIRLNPTASTSPTAPSDVPTPSGV